jgi:hypothetical protein
MTRYAIYFTPAPSTPLWTFGCSVLGYDSWRAVDVDHPNTDLAKSEQFAAWAQTPRRYGFHATLKAPFNLIDGIGEAQLADQVLQLSRSLEPVQLGKFEVAAIGNFIALVPVFAPNGLSALASICVESCEDLRAPLSEVDRKRRHAAGLSPQQAHYLERYGYPYVHDAFRFHMTLTGPLDPDEQSSTLRVLRDLYDAIDQPVELSAIVLARQEGEQRFALLDRFELS